MPPRGFLFALFLLTQAGCSDGWLRMGWFAPTSAGPNATTAIALPPPPVPGVQPAPSPLPSSSPGPMPSPGHSPAPIPTASPLPSPVAAEIPTGRVPAIGASGATPDSCPIRKILELTNEFRLRNGLSALVFEQNLGTAAQRHAERMSREGWFDHVSPEGQTPGERIMATGYAWETCGENIAMGYATAGDAMAAWIASPGHRWNLMNHAFVEMGVGYVAGRSGGPSVWVQELAARRASGVYPEGDHDPEP